MSRLADRVLRKAEREEQDETDRYESKKIERELLNITARISETMQSQSQCDVEELELQEELQTEKSKCESRRKEVRAVEEKRREWHHKNQARQVVVTGYQSQVMMLVAQKNKLQRQIEENNENSQGTISRSLMGHADVRGLEREVQSSQKDNTRTEQKLRVAEERFTIEEEKLVHLADKVKREVNQARVQAIAAEHDLNFVRMEATPLAAKRMDLMSIIQNVKADAKLARDIHEKEKASLLSRIAGEQSANDEIVSRINSKSSMEEIVQDLEEVQREKMSMQKSIDNINEINLGLKNEIHELNEVYHDTSKSLTEYNAETERMVFELETKRSEIDILQAKIRDAVNRT